MPAIPTSDSEEKVHVHCCLLTRQVASRTIDSCALPFNQS